MRDKLQKQLSWRMLMLIMAILFAIVILIVVFSGRSIKTQELAADDPVFDKTVVEEQVQTLITALDDGDYDYAQSISTEKLKPYMSEEQYVQAKDQVAENWGAFVSVDSVQTGKATQHGKEYAVAQAAVSYENVSVLYNITFDDAMQLAGFFISSNEK